MQVQIPLQVVFKDIPASKFVETRIQEKVNKLARFFDRITFCRVSIEQPHRHGHKGSPYEIHVELSVPNNELIAVTRIPQHAPEHENLYVAIKDAFSTAERQLKKYAERLRRDVKSVEHPPFGRITKLFPQEGYGFIRTPDGREIYFHENSVINEEFERLQVGTEVRFAEENGFEGPQASTVTLVG